MKGVLPQQVCWDCRGGTRYFCPSLADLSSEVQNIIFLAAHFFTIIPDHKVTWTGSRAGSPVSVSLVQILQGSSQPMFTILGVKMFHLGYTRTNPQPLTPILQCCISSIIVMHIVFFLQFLYTVKNIYRIPVFFFTKPFRNGKTPMLTRDFQVPSREGIFCL